MSKGPSPSKFKTWAFGNVSGRVLAMDMDWSNNILYIGTASGGLWKTTDDGASWTPIFAGSMPEWGSSPHSVRWSFTCP